MGSERPRFRWSRGRRWIHAAELAVYLILVAGLATHPDQGVLAAGCLAATFGLIRLAEALWMRQVDRRLDQVLRECEARSEAHRQDHAAHERATQDRVHALEEQADRRQAAYGAVRDLLATSPRLAGLLEAHLKETEGASETATLHILETLQALNTQVDRLLNTLDRALFDSAELYNSSEQKIKESRRMMEELDDYKHQLDAEIQLAIASLGRQVEELRPFTDLIRDVTERTNVLAINASIEAARAGKAGNGFAVVAGEVRQLSQQVAVAADSIETTVQKVSSTVNQRLQAIADRLRTEDETEGLSHLAEALPRLSQDFHTSVEVFNRFAQETHDAVGEMRTSILEALTNAQYQDITRQQLEQVRKGLVQMTDSLRSAGTSLTEDHPVHITSMDQIAEDLERTYTMLVQRRTHQKALDQPEAAADERPPIELF